MKAGKTCSKQEKTGKITLYFSMYTGTHTWGFLPVSLHRNILGTSPNHPKKVPKGWGRFQKGGRLGDRLGMANHPQNASETSKTSPTILGWQSPYFNTRKKILKCPSLKKKYFGTQLLSFQFWYQIILLM